MVPGCCLRLAVLTTHFSDTASRKPTSRAYAIETMYNYSLRIRVFPNAPQSRRAPFTPSPLYLERSVLLPTGRAKDRPSVRNRPRDILTSLPCPWLDLLLCAAAVQNSACLSLIPCRDPVDVEFLCFL